MIANVFIYWTLLSCRKILTNFLINLKNTYFFPQKKIIHRNHNKNYRRTVNKRSPNQHHHLKINQLRTIIWHFDSLTHVPSKDTKRRQLTAHKREPIERKNRSINRTTFAHNLPKWHHRHRASADRKERHNQNRTDKGGATRRTSTVTLAAPITITTRRFGYCVVAALSGGLSVAAKRICACASKARSSARNRTCARRRPTERDSTDTETASGRSPLRHHNKNHELNSGALSGSWGFMVDPADGRGCDGSSRNHEGSSLSNGGRCGRVIEMHGGSA